MKRLSFFVLFSILILPLVFSQTPTTTPIALEQDPETTLEPTLTSIPTLTPTPVPVEGAGDVWIYPEQTTISAGSSSSVEIHVDSGNQLLASYQITVTFDYQMIYVDDVVEGGDGFISSVG